MSAPRIYHNVPISVNTEILLSDNTVQHVVNVLRLKPGAEIHLFNGDGHEYSAVLTAQGKRQFGAFIKEKSSGIAESPCHITLGQAISRGEKMDYAIQKAVELGVSAIQPLITARIAMKVSREILQKRQQHWQGVAISACEQSGRCVVPFVEFPITLDEWLPQCMQSIKLVLDPTSTQILPTLPSPPSTVALLIGPEGGLSAEEIKAAQQHHFQATHLGPRILRTETAAVCALSLLQYVWGDLI